MEKKIGSRGLVFEPHKKAIIDFFEVVDAIHFEEDVGWSMLANARLEYQTVS